MLERPAIEDTLILTRLRDDYDLSISELTFLPLGADQNTAVYRAVGRDGEAYFIKLRSGDFDESSVAVPRFLSDRGLREIIAPRVAADGRPWAEMGDYRLIVYPFVESRDGYEVELTPSHWRVFGAALRRVHDAELPPALAALVRREAFAPRWRERLREFIQLAATRDYEDEAAAAMAALLNRRRREILELVTHAERLAAALQTRPPGFVLCHSDLHAGNIVLDNQDKLYIVDWDQPIMAPRERDLMFPGGAQGFRGCSPAEEESLFFAGYGASDTDPTAVAYYRFERIVEDLAVFGAQLLLSDEGGADRPTAVGYVNSNFQPGGTIERAYAALAEARRDAGDT